MDDVRIWAAILAIVGVAVGILLPAWILLILTVLIILFVVVVIARDNSPAGTSGGMGLLILLAGGAISFLVPMWLARAFR